MPPVPESPWVWGIWTLGCLWALFVCYHFYQISPFPHLVILDRLLPDNFSLLPTLNASLDYLLGLGLAVVMVTAAAFVGRILLLKFLKDSASSLEFFVVSTALGIGVLAYLTLGLGVARLLYPPALLIGLILVFIGALLWFSRPEEKSYLKGVWRDFSSCLFTGGLGSLLGFLFLFILLTDFVMAFVPELFYDALVYHLGAPNFYLKEHGIVPLDLLPAKFPFTLQMINLLGLALKDEMVTKLNHFFMMVLLSGGMMALGLRLKKPLLGLVAALAFCSTPTVQLNVWTSGVDVGVSLFGFLAAVTFFVSLETPSVISPWFLLSSLFAGLAVASKYTVVYVPIVLGLMGVGLFVAKQRSFKATALRLLVFSALVFLLLLPWLLKNWFETGNPVYPFLSKIFGGLTMEPYRYQHLRGENTGLTPQNIFGWARLLWDLSIQERSSLSFQGPMALACAPFLILGFLRERSRWLKLISVYSLLFLVIGLFMTRLTRYLLPGGAVAACLLAFGLEAVFRDSSWIRRWGGLFIFSLCYLYQMSWAYILIGSSIQPQNVLLGRESRFDFSNRYHSGMNPNPSTQMYQYIEKNFSKGQKVLLVGEEKGYPINVRHTYSGVYDRGPLVWIGETSRNPEEVAAKLTAEGLTHLMVNYQEVRRLGGYGIFNWTPQAFGIFCAFWERYLLPVHIEYVDLGGGAKNPIVLLEILSQGRGPERPFQNIMAPSYEEFEFPRQGISSDKDRLRFYEERLKEWPDVVTFQNRVRELRAN